MAMDYETSDICLYFCVARGAFNAELGTMLNPGSYQRAYVSASSD